MNVVAITIGLIYGIAAAVAGYLVSQLSSGLFARPFYRIYARVLIGICLIMLLAPVLQGVASLPVTAKVLLSLADYCACFVLSFGVVVFNRKFMKSVFLHRRVTAYFTFGTLVYATLVTLVLLHLSTTVDLTTGMASVAPVGPGHYAPFAILLAALVFHTDHHLKLSSKSVRQFSTFTFVGYAISFVAIGLSMMPYFGEALAGLGLRPHEELFLANFSCLQTLFLAIILYAALVWHRDSIPPVYLLLLTICAEYHVLVTQWLIRDDVLGTSAWALTAMPLVIGIDALARYFKLWEKKRQERQQLLQTADGEAGAALLAQGQPRFVTPFAVISSGLTAGFLLLTLWTRFSTNVALWSPSWLAVTFVAYAVYYSISAVVRRNPVHIYAAALLAGMAALFGVDPIFSPLSVLILAIFAAIWLGLATISERWRLRRTYRTALADAGLISAVVALLIVLVRHSIEIGRSGTAPYMFGTVMLTDGSGLASMTLVLVALALALATWAYRSRLPMYGALVAVVAIVPVMSAGIAFMACAVADLIRHRVKTTRRASTEKPLRLFDRVGLPQQDQIPELYAGPLTAGTLPLSFMGLAIAVYYIVFSGVLPGVLPEVPARATWLPILSAVTSAVVLGLFTRSHRWRWLYVVSLAAGYFGIQSAAQLVVQPASHQLSFHLTVATVLSLVGWIVAASYSTWCWIWIKRVAEEAELPLRERQQFYAGTLFLVSFTAATAVLIVLSLQMLVGVGTQSPGLWLLTSALLAAYFALSSGTFGSQIGSYLSLCALGLTAWGLAPYMFDGVASLQNTEFAVTQSLSLQLLALALAAFTTVVLRWTDLGRESKVLVNIPKPWTESPLPLRAEGWLLWAKPMAQSALLFTSLAVIQVRVTVNALWSASGAVGVTHFHLPLPALVTCGSAALTLLLCTRAYRVPFLYITAIFLAYSTVHATAHTLWLSRCRDVDALSWHVLLGAAVSILAWGAAQVCSTWCEFSKSRSADTANEAIGARESFYAGLLRRFSLAAGVVALALLSVLTVANQIGVPGDARITAIAGLGLAAIFGIELATFRSQSLSYLSLATICLTGYNVVVWLFPFTAKGVHDGVMLSFVALVMGLLAWTSSSLTRSRERIMAQSPISAANSWQSLWVPPLASTSIVLGVLALAHILLAWGQAAMFWTVLPFYMVSAVWILGTSVALQGKLAMPWILPEGLYALAIVNTCVALHITSHVWLLPAQTALPAILSWHLLANGCMLICGWAVATVYALGYSKVRQTNKEACNDKRLEVYAGQLNHVTATVATISLPFLWSAGWICEPATSPVVFAAGLVLAAYFCLAALTYHSQIGSYLSLAAVSVTAFHFFSVIGLWQQLPKTASGLGMAVAGLLMIAVASVLYRRHEVADEKRVLGRLPSHGTSPLPFLKEPTLRRLWCKPLANFSLLLMVVSIGLVSPSFTLLSWATEQPENTEMVPVAATFVFASATGLLAARIYRAGALTYAAGAALWLSLYPLLAIVGMSATQGGPVFGSLALLLWLASFAVEWMWPLHQDSAVTSTTSDDIPSNAGYIFQQPLVRCGAIAAVAAIVHSLIHCSLNGWREQSLNLLQTCGAAAVTLLLAARSMDVLNRIGRARLLVYLGCLAASACWIVAAVAVWEFDGLPWAAAMLAMVLASVGLVLKEGAVNYHGSRTVARLRLFGEPIANVALAFPAFAVLATILTTLLAGPSWLALSLSLIGMTVAYLISVRTTANPQWLYPSAIAATGAALVVLWGVLHLTVGKLMFASLLLMHALVVVARVIHGHRRRTGLLLGVDGAACERAFREWPLVVAVGVVMGQIVYFLTLATGNGSGLGGFWPWPWTAGLSVLLFLHLGYLKWQPTLSHFAIGSSLLALAWLGLWSEWTFSPDVVSLVGGLLWGSIATLILRSSPQSPTKLGVLSAFAEDSIRWSAPLCGLAVLVTVPCWIMLQPAYPTTCICWLLIAAACAWWGYEWHMGPSRIGQPNIDTQEPEDFDWVRAGVAAEALAAVLLLLSVGAGLFFIRDSAARFAGDWFSLAGFAATVLAIVYVMISSRLRRTPGGDGARERFPSHTGVALSYVAAFAAGVATVLLLPSVHLDSASLLPAISLALLAGCWFYMAWALRLEPLVYVAEAVVAEFALYVRYGLLNKEWRPDFETAFGIVCGSFLFYGLHTFLVSRDAHEYRLFQRPFYRTSIALPLILPLVTPYQPQQLPFSLVVFATGALYSLIGYLPGRRWPLYVAAGLYNLGIYLWVPVISDTFSLVQLYVIPAALTVLIFAHLHRRDLNHQALTGVRLMAASTILAVSTFDAFFGAADQNLPQFLVVLLLSLAAIAAGIATHVRPFVYAGIAFMVINVLAQLGLQFHVTEDGIVRATILIALGLFVIAVMVFFNIRREQILKRYHHFISDPRWE